MQEQVTYLPPIVYGAIAVAALLIVPMIFGFISKRLFSKRAYPYIPVDKLVSDGEWAFYKALREAVPGKMHICLKVRLGDIIRCPDPSTAKKHAGAIASKHVDFVLVHEDSSKVALCIEVDDGPIGFISRLRRDLFVDNALSAAGIPIMRIRPRAFYNSAALRRQMINKIYQRPQFS